MSQIRQLGAEYIVPSTPQSNASLDSTCSRGIKSILPPSYSPTIDILPPVNNPATMTTAALKYSNHESTSTSSDSSSSSTSSTDTSASARSSTSNASHASSLSASRPKPTRHSNPTVSNSSASKLNARSSPPTVRFTEPEPLPRCRTRSTPMSLIRPQPAHSRYTVPSPLLALQYQNLRVPEMSSPALSLQKAREEKISRATPRPQSILITRPRRLSTQTVNTRTSTSTLHPSSTMPSSRSSPNTESRTSKAPLPNRASVPNLNPSLAHGSRVHSYTSTHSTQSAPAILSTPPNPAIPQGQYDPLQHYIPCLWPACSKHYTAAHAGSMYYVPQGPFSLTRLHGYCPRHATQELAEASALCKREWEFLRQSAGRKTLPQIAAEFEAFMKQFRSARAADDAQLLQELRSRVVGGTTTATTTTAKVQSPTAGEKANTAKTRPKVQFDIWDWRYTPHRCTAVNCKANPYSPYASHLYIFYHSPRPSTFKPLHTLCPRCANREVEDFERRVSEKWSSRCDGWNEQEWDEWLGNVVRDREMDAEFTEKAQEKMIKDKGTTRRVETMEQGKRPEKAAEKASGQISEKVGEKASERVAEKVGGVGVKGKRMSIFKRLIVSMKA
ncbi:hypothetical protein IAQ61_000408 [Plenodomus lingam]|uniref:uncharacterized protein n=1 Tax=Leptosphaeria maculans TaxID=5022 RepID=UPI00331A71F3|nr:hypothetical protein IAQ61_000408 [Plenodomus lingam]